MQHLVCIHIPPRELYFFSGLRPVSDKRLSLGSRERYSTELFGRFWGFCKGSPHTRVLHPSLLVEAPCAGPWGRAFGLVAGRPLWLGLWCGTFGASSRLGVAGGSCVALGGLGSRVLLGDSAFCGVDAPQRTGNIRKTSKRVRITWRHFVGPRRALYFLAIGW